MPRVKRGTKRRARRKKYLKRTKGFFLTKSKLYQSAQEAANRAERYAKRDRRVRKREYRRLWIQRVGAAARVTRKEIQSALAAASHAQVPVDRVMARGYLPPVGSTSCVAGDTVYEHSAIVTAGGAAGDGGAAGGVGAAGGRLTHATRAASSTIVSA